MYEQFGVEGLKAFQKTVDYCHEKGLVVIGDVKRGDIGSTSAAYAVGHLGKVQLKDDKIASLREQVKKLEDDKKKLIVQLVDYEELKAENERLKKQLTKK